MKKSEAETYLYFMSYRIRLLLKGVKQMKTKMFMATVSIVLSIVFFSVPCFSQTINGCYHNKNGKLRVVSDLSQCKRTELPITWNVGGTQGPPGPPGERGLQGPSGGLKVYSVNDEYLGELISMSIVFYNPSLSKFISISPGSGRNNLRTDASNLWFEDDSCLGTPRLQLNLDTRYNVITATTNENEFKHYIWAGDQVLTTCRSFYQTVPPYGCNPSTPQDCLTSPATEVTLPFAYPVLLPLRFE